MILAGILDFRRPKHCQKVPSQVQNHRSGSQKSNIAVKIVKHSQKIIISHIIDVQVV